jgi:hypothetical protein
MLTLDRSSFRKIGNAFGRQLTWRSSGFFSRTHELCADRDLFARIQWVGFRRSALAEADSARWRLRPKGTFTRDLFILDETSGATIASVDWSIRKTTVVLAGVAYTLRRTGLFRMGYAVQDALGNPLLRTGVYFPFRGRRGWTRVEAPGAGCPHLAELAILSWFLAVRDQRRAAHSG